MDGCLKGKGGRAGKREGGGLLSTRYTKLLTEKRAASALAQACLASSLSCRDVGRYRSENHSSFFFSSNTVLA